MRMSYLPEAEYSHVNKTLGIWPLDEDTVSDEYFAIAFAAPLIIQFAIRFAKVQVPIYFAVTRQEQLFSSKKVPGRDYFLIFIGGEPFYHLMSFCHRLAALPPFCVAIGKNSVQTSFDYKDQDLLQIVKRLCEEDKGLEHILFPADFDCTMSNSALAYILGHEIAHITHGHLSFISSAKFKREFVDDEDKYLTLRTLEMDADSSGTSLTAELFENPTTRNHIIGYEIDQSDELARTRNRYKYIAGIYAAHLYGDARLKNSDSKKYPDPYTRFLTSKSVLQRCYLLTLKNNDLDTAPEEVRDLLAKTFISMSGRMESLQHPFVYNITLVNDDPSKNIHVYHPLGESKKFEGLTPLKKRWARIRSDLEHFSVGGNLAPAQADPA